jgi:hypothetical protein
MIIITDNKSSRFEYISHFLLEDVLGFVLQDQSPMPGEAIIAYTVDKPSFPAIHIVPYGLLTETGIREQQLLMDRWEEMPCFFNTEGDIPFDIFSAAFFLVSRYEEYLDHEKDAYGRYSHRGSLAFLEGFLDLPIVELWAQKLREMIRWTFPNEKLGFRKFRYLPTYDIDHAWCYLRKGLLRTVGQLVMDIATANFKRFQQRFRVLRGLEKDPYDIYEWLDALHLKYGLKPYYFFPLAKKVQGYDRNISPYDKKLRDLMAYHASGYRTGVHPSWQSGDNIKVLREEFVLFSTITGSEPEYSRFHFLRFNLPEDYRKLLDHGITEEHSMGYGTINGFRASVSTPFKWYDLAAEKLTNLLVYPYCWMDANSYYEQNYKPSQAYDELKHYHDVVKKVRGTLVTISHNNFLSTESNFAGWKEVYEIFLNDVVYWDL